MADFPPILRRRLEMEGVRFNAAGDVTDAGYTNDPDDSGGETIFGVTKEVAVANGWTEPMARMPYSFAEGVDRKRYWGKILGDDIPDQRLAQMLFDVCVNMGPGVAVRFIERALNALNNKAQRWPDVLVDTEMNPETLVALGAALSENPRNGACLRAMIRGQAVARYIDACEAKEKNEKYQRGWINGWVTRDDV